MAPKHSFRITIILTVFLLCSACTEQKTNVAPVEIEPDLVTTVEKANKLDDILVRSKSIQLEYSGKSAIGRVTQLAVGSNGDLAIIDKPNHQLLIFDKEGKWLHTFTQDDILGPGVKYTRLNHAEFVTSSEIALSFQNKHNLYLLHLSSGSVKKLLVKKDAHILDFAVTRDGEFLTLVRNIGGVDQQTHFLVIDRDGDVKKKWAELSSKKIPNILSFFPKLQGIEIDKFNSVYFSNGYEGKIYKYSLEGELIAIFSLNAFSEQNEASDLPSSGRNASNLKFIASLQYHLFNHFVLEDGLLMVLYGEGKKPYYRLGDINGKWYSEPFLLSKQYHKLMAKSGANLYSIIWPDIAESADQHVNPTVMKFQIGKGDKS